MEVTVDMNIYQNSHQGQHTQSQTPVRTDDRRYKEYRLYSLVAVSFGLLCVLQVTLNIYLRLVGGSCPEGWLSFGSSCYHISASHRNWTDSKEDCHQREAELIVINSQEEQEFVKALSVTAWIGLSCSEEGRVWKWVDGRPLTTGFWSTGEPNNNGNNENCAESWPRSPSLESWNDASCDSESHWICKRTP
ncbi:C-type lectin domain family 4 member M-like [Clupea harengus]|uniref:C-type lectin domain family 4 member M-like n=1 Tax=Clupea harengus TaxID=7950 RepID=A0A6P8EJC9_CLUHA|nr:C-type lectin domain family 4 member M-like [Clupea harengus]